MKKRHITTLLAVISLGLLSSAPVLAENAGNSDDDTVAQAEELGNAKATVIEAAAVVKQIDADADARQMLNRAKAVFIVPDYARASFIAGASGGQGVLISQNDNGWSAPAFYNIGGISFGATAGIEGGSIAFMLLSDNALQGFESENNFSLNADAGLTIVDWSERAQASAGKGPDVVVWSDTEGLYGNLSVSVTDIYWDEEANAAYYGGTVKPDAIITGKVSDPMKNSDLRSEFSALEEGGSNGQGQSQGQKGNTSGPANQKTNQPASQNGQ